MKNVYLHSVDSSFSATLSDKLGAGGEGTVYSIEGHTDICVKRYHKDKINITLENKLKAMLAHPPLDPTLSFGHYSICWPTHLVYASEDCTEFLGFAMPLIDKTVFKEYHLLCDKPGASSSVCYRLENFGTGFTYLHMYAVALNLVTCVMNIHKAGHAIGDLNDKNILVSTKDSKLTVVDCDSFEIRDADTIRYDCNVYMPEFSAPEVIKREKIDDRQLSDRFSLAILIFKLLMLNTHPYASRGSSVEHLNTPEEKIMSGYYPYKEYENLDVRPPVYALPYYIIPPEISELFDRCFVEGQNNPEKRPTPEEWFIALKANYDTMYAYYKKNKTMCSENVLHVFPRHLEECPWCEMKDDYFPMEFLPSVQQKTIQNEIKEKLRYLEELIENYAVDKKITSFEYENILSEAKRKNIIQSKAESLIKLKTENTCVIGDTPILSRNEVHLSASYSDKNELRTLVYLKNKYQNDVIEVLIQPKNSSIKVNPEKITIQPNEEVQIKVFTLTDHFSVFSFGLCEHEVDFLSKSLTHKVQDKLKLKVTFEKDTPKYLKHFVNPKIFFLTAFLVFTLIFFYQFKVFIHDEVNIYFLKKLFILPVIYSLSLFLIKNLEKKFKFLWNYLIFAFTVILYIIIRNVKSDTIILPTHSTLTVIFLMIIALLTSTVAMLHFKINKPFNNILYIIIPYLFLPSILLVSFYLFNLSPTFASEIIPIIRSNTKNALVFINDRFWYSPTHAEKLYNIHEYMYMMVGDKEKGYSYKTNAGKYCFAFNYYYFNDKPYRVRFFYKDELIYSNNMKLVSLSKKRKVRIHDLEIDVFQNDDDHKLLITNSPQNTYLINLIGNDTDNYAYNLSFDNDRKFELLTHNLGKSRVIDILGWDGRKFNTTKKTGVFSLNDANAIEAISSPMLYVDGYHVKILLSKAMMQILEDIFIDENNIRIYSPNIINLKKNIYSKDIYKQPKPGIRKDNLNPPRISILKGNSTLRSINLSHKMKKKYYFEFDFRKEAYDLKGKRLPPGEYTLDFYGKRQNIILQ